MKLDPIVIIEDIHPIIKLLKKQMNDKLSNLVTHFFNEEIFKEQLCTSSVKENRIIFVNICFKWHPDVKRTEFAGIKRIIKEGLRINWLRREPVIAYGTLPEDVILNSSMGQIFKSNRHHLYFDLTKINEIDLYALINAVSPIPDENKLREIIVKYCAPELKDFLRRTNHYLEKMYKLDRNFKSERKQFLWRLRHVKKIFPDLEAEGTTNTVKLLEEANESKKDKIKRDLRLILKKIKEKEEELLYVSS